MRFYLIEQKSHKNKYQTPQSERDLDEIQLRSQPLHDANDKIVTGGVVNISDYNDIYYIAYGEYWNLEQARAAIGQIYKNMTVIEVDSKGRYFQCPRLDVQEVYKVKR